MFKEKLKSEQDEKHEAKKKSGQETDSQRHYMNPLDMILGQTLGDG